VVLKLFNIVQPDAAYFGEKDYQQLCIIRRMVSDFNLDLKIVPVSTVREPDGLALSSRNIYLEPSQRAAAPLLFRTLTAARKLIESGETESGKIKAAAARLLAADPQIRIEYFEIVDSAEVQPIATISGSVRIAAAIWIGKTRLIDNVAATGVPHHET
jgi:pantoate--beta-alanine ligase